MELSKVFLKLIYSDARETEGAGGGSVSASTEFT